MKKVIIALVIQITAYLLVVGNIWLSETTLWKLSIVWLLIFAGVLTIVAIKIIRKNYGILKGKTKFASWCVGAFSAIMLTGITVFSALLLFTWMLFGGVKKLETFTSPDDSYRITFYSFDAGAMGTFGVRGELHGPLGFRKDFYYEQHASEVEVDWLQAGTVQINGHKLDLTQGEIRGFRMKGQ